MMNPDHNPARPLAAMPVDPEGVFVRVLRRKPEMQDRDSTEAIVAEEVCS